MSQSSVASTFNVGSSRITVCGQAPVSTAKIRRVPINACALQTFGIFMGDEIIGDDR